MIPISVWNLSAFSGQVLLVVAVAAPMLRLVHVPEAWARLAYWQAVVAACLALPWLPWPTSPGPSEQVAVTTSEVVAAAVALDLAIATDIGSVIAGALAISIGLGVLLRGGWLIVGLVRLRALRHEGHRAELDEDVEVLRLGLAARAEVRWNDRVGQPATFGWRHPVILLPAAVAGLDPRARRAVVCHELVHASRGDWAWHVVEEIVSCLFWFHPALRWALGQIRVSREEVVDQRVVALTSVRQQYMKALVTFASAPAVMGAAVPFVAHRHLASRITRLAEERTMTRRELTFSGLVLIATLGMSAWAAASALPIEVVPPPPPPPSAERSLEIFVADVQPVAQRDAPLRVGGDVRPPQKIYNVNPVYPAEAQAAGIQGVVIIQILIDKEGMVREVEVVRSIPELDQAAMDAVWQWMYTPTLMNGEPVEVLMYVTVNFTLTQ